MTPTANRLTYTVPELAQLLGVGVQSIYNHVDSALDIIETGVGMIPVIRVGQRVVIPKSAVGERLGLSIDEMDRVLGAEEQAS